MSERGTYCWRVVVATFVAALVAGLSLIWVDPLHRAHAAPAELLESSQSCADFGVATTLTIWGSGFAPNNDFNIFSDMLGLGPNGLQAHSDQSGNFTLTNVGYDPVRQVDGGPTDVISTDDGVVTRDIRIVFPPTPGAVQEPPCPASTPSVRCVVSGDTVTSSGLLLPVNKPDPGAPTEWYVDYPGAGASPSPFDHSQITPGLSTSGTLPAGLVPGSSHLVTDISRLTPGRGPSRDDIYVTFPITVCAGTSPPPPPPPPTTPPPPPPPGTTTNPGSTPVSPGTPGTTVTLPPGSPSPVLSLSPAVAPTGGVVVVTGNGFPAGISVVVRWDQGIGSVLVKTTGALGHFLAQLPVLPHDQLGRRNAIAVGFPTAVAPMLVAPSAIEPGGSNIAILYHN